MIICKNCSTHFDGKYCNNCRQLAETNRITWHGLMHYLTHALFHVDRGFLYTLKELTLRPGYTIRDYLNGKRIYHFNPFLFMILIGGLVSLLFSTLNVQLPVKEIELEEIERFNTTIAHKYFAVAGLIYIILLSVTDFIFFFNKKFNLPELLVSNTFQTGQILVITTVFFPILFFQNFVAHTFGVDIEIRVLLKALVFIFLFWVRYQLYEAKRSYWVITKIVIQITVVYIFYNYVIAGLIVHWQKA
jgi:hypothetical protein